MSSVGNPLLAIADAVPARIKEVLEARDRHIAALLELNQEYATLLTLTQVAPTRSVVGEPVGPSHEGSEVATHAARRRARDTAGPAESPLTGTPAA